VLWISLRDWFDFDIIFFVSTRYIGEQLQVPSPILFTLDFQRSRHVGLRCQGQKGDPKREIKCYKNASTLGYIQVTHHVNVTVREFLRSRARDDYCSQDF
jgi:hypothetical protein